MNRSILSQLDDAVYLTQEEAIIHPREVYLKEEPNLGVYIVELKDLSRIAEQHDLSYKQATSAIAEAYGLSYNSIVVDIREDTIIEHPDLILEVDNIIISPISSKEPVSIYIEESVNSTLTGNSDNLTKFPSILKEQDTYKALAKLRRMRSDLMRIAESGNHTSISYNSRVVAKAISSVIHEITK